MALTYYPSPGEILACHFDPEAIPPEMRKTRPVIVVSPRLRRRPKLVTVVPLSTTAPEPEQSYHYFFTLDQPLPVPFNAAAMWAKCDMICTVSLDRLDRFKDAKSRHGAARRWRTGQVSAVQLAAIRVAILAGLGFDN